jgi:hypothetical protein
LITRDSISAIRFAQANESHPVFLGEIAIDLPRCEGASVIHFGFAETFETPTHFWRRSQRAFRNFNGDLDRCFGVSTSDFCYHQLTEERTLELLQECFDGNDIFTARLNSLGQFRWGTALHDEWCTKIAVSQFGHMYYATYWDTRA